VRYSSLFWSQMLNGNHIGNKLGPLQKACSGLRPWLGALV
jgi:hypothetical protein